MLKFQIFAIFQLLFIISTEADLSKIKFYKYTKNGREEINLNQPLNLKINNPTKHLKILCHGWQSDVDTHWYETTALAYLHSNQPNVFSIDWGHFAKAQYQDAVLNAYQVGEFLGKLVYEIHKITELPLENFHLIGHSLGAHVMGMVGQYVTKFEGKIGRITGLDPAGPSFDRTELVKRLSFDDAYFVDVIHTNTLFLGYKQSMGHVDLWPNGGRDQVGCNGNFGCSHGRAPEFYAESVNSTAFPSWYCGSIELFNERRCFGNTMVYMGDKTPSNIRGNFYLETNEKQPYGKPLESYGV